MSNSTNSLAEKRIRELLDEQSFVEFSAMVTARSTDFNLAKQAAPSDGVITGYGLIDGNLVYVYSQDAQVMHGTIGEMHSKKIVALYDMAMKMGAPIIGLLDCAGIRLQESVDALQGLGAIYAKQVEASGVIPQISVIFGSCGGGLTVLPGLSDFTFMEKDAKLFVNAPNAICGNHKGKCDSAEASFQSANNGLVDGVGSEEEIFETIRQLITFLPGNCDEGGVSVECQDDLNRLCENLEGFKGDTGLLLTTIADDNFFLETKKDYAKEMVTGFLSLNGMTIGAIANRTQILDEEGKETEAFEAKLTADGCQKAADFVRFCDAFDLPILTLTQVEGFYPSLCSEKRLAKAMATMTAAFANATVPKVNLFIGNAYGSGYIMMNSKALGADLVYAWDSAKIGMMDAKLAAGILFEKEGAQVIEEKAKEYDDLQQSVLSSAKRGYVDVIITPEQTRKYLVAAFEMLYTKCVEGPMKKHGAK